MGRYDKFGRPELPSLGQRWRPHPLWGPLGCFFALVVLGLAYGLASWFYERNAEAHWVIVPPDVLVPGRDPLLGAKLFTALVLAFLVYALLGLMYALAIKGTGATFYTPLDVPAPIRRRRRLVVFGFVRRWVWVLALGLGVFSVHWAMARAVWTPPDWLYPPAGFPLPYIYLYVLAALIWWAVLQGVVVLLEWLVIVLLRGLR